MIPDRPEELHVLAGEYVLGVLEPDKAREVEHALVFNADLRQSVTLWEERLHGLSGLAPSVPPPSDVWRSIAARIDNHARRPSLWRSLLLWRSATAFAAAAAAGLALYIALAAPPASPRFVAVLHAAQQAQPVWLATAGQDGLLVRAVAGSGAPKDHVFELWAIGPGAPRPRSLGVIPADGRLELGVLPAALQAGTTLAISIEPEGGSPTGQPTGPVVFQGALEAAK